MSELEIIQAKLEEIKAITILSTKKVYTVAEAALYLGMAPDYVKKLCKARKIKSYRSSTGKRIYLHQSDLDKWMLHTEVNTNEYIRSEAARIASRCASRAN